MLADDLVDGNAGAVGAGVQSAPEKVCTIISNLITAFTFWDLAIGSIASEKLNMAKIIAKGGKQ